MQSLDDSEIRKVFGEVLADQLQTILEYVQEIPLIKQKLQTVDERLVKVEDRLVVIEVIVRAHETDIRHLTQKLA